MNILRSKAGTLYAEVIVGSPESPLGTIRFTARGVRRERNSVYATVGIWWDSNQLEYDDFNTWKNEERRKLAKGAWNLLPEDERGVRNWLPLDELKADLDLFCEDLWAAHVGRIKVKPLVADKFYPRKMLGPYVVEEGGTILFGPPGGGKSTVTYMIARSMGAGCSRVWEIRGKHKPLLVNLERSEKDVLSKMWGIDRALGLDPEDSPIDTIHARGATLRDIEYAAQRHIEENGNDVLFLDSLSRIGGGSLLNDEVANAAMDMLNRLCPTWFTIAHEAKGGSDPVTGEKKQASTFGSQMLRAACDLEVRLSGEQESMKRLITTLQVTKKNIPLVSLRETLYLEMDDRGLSEVLRPESWDRFKKA